MANTIQKQTMASTKILRSEFIATLYPCPSLSEIQALLREHNTLYSNATHNCYAYILGLNKEIQHYSDAGEPSGTAGKPILNTLLRNDLSAILAVVTRYYGGIKLGVKGLIDAYSEVTEMAICTAQIVPLAMYRRYIVTTEYGLLDTIRHHINQFEGKEIACEYSSEVLMKIDINEESYDEFEKILLLLKNQKRLEYYTEE